MVVAQVYAPKSNPMSEQTNFVHDLQPLCAIVQRLADPVDRQKAILLIDATQSAFRRELETLTDRCARLEQQLLAESNRRRQLEAVIREDASRVQCALAASGCAIWEWDVADRRVFFSGGWETIIGFSEGELGDTIEEWSLRIHPDDLAQLAEAATKLLRGLVDRFTVKHRIRCRDDNYKWVRTHANVFQPARDGRPERIVGTVVDIAVEMAAAATQQLQQQRFQQLIELSPEAIIVSRNGRFIHANPAMLRLLGASELDQLIGRTAYDIMAAHQTTSLQARLASANVQIGALPVVEQEFIRFDGSRVEAQVATVAYHDQEGLIMQSIVRETAAQKQVAAKVQQQNEILATLYETMRDLLNQLEVSSVLQAILTRAGQLLATNDGVVYILNPELDVMEAQIASGTSAAWVGYRIPRHNEGIVGRIWASGEPLTVDNDGAWRHHLPDSRTTGNHALLGVPLCTEAGVVGVLGLRREVNHPFSDDEVALIVRFGQLAALALQNARLYAAAQQELDERRRIAAALRDSEARLHRIVQHLPAGAIYVHGEEIFLNPHAGAILGDTGADIAMLQTWFAQLNPEHGEATHVIGPATRVIASPNDGPRVVEYTGYHEGTIAVWLLRDVTERERLSRLMAQTEKAALVGGWELHIATNQLYWTAELHRILGTDPAVFAVTPENILSFQEQEAIDSITDSIQFCIETGDPISLDVELTTFHGQQIWVRLTANVEFQAGIAIRIFGSVQDITETKRVERALYASEERLQLAIESSEEAPWDWHVNTNDLFMSPRWTEILGYEAHELPKQLKNSRHFCHPHDWPLVAAKYEQHLAGNSPLFTSEHRWRHRNGDWVWVHVHAKVVKRDADGRPLRLVGTLRDISYRKEVEAALRESELRFRQLAEHVDAVFWLTEANPNRLLYVSPAYEQLWQRPAATLREKPMDWLEAVHPADRSRVYETISAQLLSGDYDCEYRLLRQDGTVRWVRDRAFPIQDERGEIWRVAGLSEDITERKLHHEALQSLLDCSRITGPPFFAALVEMLAAVLGVRCVILAEIQPDQPAVITNVACWEDGKAGDPATYPRPGALLAEIVRRSKVCFYQQGIRNDFPADPLLAALDADGFLCAPLLAADGAHIGLLMALHNTPLDEARNPAPLLELFANRAASELERAQAEQELRRQGIEMQQMLDGVNALVWLLDTQGRILRANRMARQLGAANFAQIEGLTLIELFPDDPDIAVLAEQARTVVHTQQQRLGTVVEWRINQTLRWSSVDQIPLFDDAGQISGVLVFVYGITELKQAEAEIRALNAQLEQRVEDRTAQLEAANVALNHSEQHLRQIIDLVPHYIFAKDRAGRYMLVNQAVADHFGTTVDALLGKTPVDFGFDAQQYDELNQSDRAMIESGRPRTTAIQRIVRPDGSQQILQTTVMPYHFTEVDQPALVGIGIDVTEQQRVEEELRQSEARLRALLEAVPDMVLRISRDGRFLDFAATQNTITPVPHDQIIGASIHDLPLSPATIRDSLRAYARALETGEMQTIEYATATEVGIEYFEARIVRSGPNEVVAITRNITERVATAMALRESEARFRSIFEQAAVGIAHIQLTGELLLVNQRFCEIVGFPRQELMRLTIAELTHPDDLPMSTAAIERLLAGDDTTFSVEKRYRHKNGRYVWVNITVSLVRRPTGEPNHLISIIEDIGRRRQAEDALRASEEKFTKLFFTSPSPKLITRVRDNQVLEVNDRCLELFGRTRAEVLSADGSTLAQWGIPVAQPATVLALQVEGVIDNTEVTIPQSHGERRIALMSAALIQLEREPCVLWAATDITEQKRTDAALRVSEQRLRQIIDLVPHMIFAKDDTGRFILANQALAAFFHTTTEEIVGRTNHVLTPSSEEALRFRADDQEVISSGKSKYILEEEVTDADGNKHIWRTIKIPFTFSGADTPAVLGVSTDITELRRAEIALSESEARFRQFAEHVPFIVFMLAADTRRLIYVNSAYEQIFGEPLATVYRNPMHWLRRVHSEDRSALLTRLRSLGSVPCEHEFRIIRQNGQVCWLNFIHIPVLNDQGEYTLFTGIAEDITMRKVAIEQAQRWHEELEARVRLRTAELEVANHEMESFSYSVSHDLRAPLRAISGFSQALFEDYGALLDDEGKNYLKRVRAASQRMAALIDDMLTLSRVTRQEMRRVPVNLSEIARGIAADLHAAQPDRVVEFVIAPNVQVEGDFSLLQIVLDNLLRNAWKYTGKHARAHIEFGVWLESGERVYFVKDDGAGFDMTYADKLFGAFQRLHREAEFEGTGVGLATVQRIIHRHGGRVWAHGAVEQGATFCFVLA